MPINDVYLGMELLLEMFACLFKFSICLPVCYTVCIND